MIKRRKSKLLKIGTVEIGGGSAVSIQSMCNTPTKDIDKTLSQIKDLYNAGAQIVRLSVLDNEDAEALYSLVEQSPAPLVADIHFDASLALKSIDASINGLRLNPGNIQDPQKVIEIAKEASKKDIPIRVGVNAGSLDRKKYPKLNAQNMVLSALEQIQLLEEIDFKNIKVSLKASDPTLMVEANRLFCNERDYPLHLGVTEAGNNIMSAVRSSIGIGSLLMQGIGDTIRVSVAGDPLKEIPIAKEILLSLGLKEGIYWIACPTCGRTEVNVEKIVSSLSQVFSHIKAPLKIAVMGCIVNGPGEAKEADIALVGGKSKSLIYKKDQLIKTVSNDEILNELTKIIDEHIQNLH